MAFSALLEVEETENTAVLESTHKIDLEKFPDKATEKALQKLEKDKFQLLLKVSAINLVKMEFVSKMNPIFKVFTLDKKRNIVYRSEIVSKSSSPHWKMFSLKQSDFAPDWKFKQLIFKVYDKNILGMSEVIGRVEFNSTLLIAAAVQKVSVTWRLFKPSRLYRGVFRMKGKLKLEWALANQEIPSNVLSEADESFLSEAVFEDQTKDAEEQYESDEDETSSESRGSIDWTGSSLSESFSDRSDSIDRGFESGTLSSSDLSSSLVRLSKDREMIASRSETGISEMYDSATEEQFDTVPEVTQTTVKPASRKRSRTVLTPVIDFDVEDVFNKAVEDKKPEIEEVIDPEVKKTSDVDNAQLAEEEEPDNKGKIDGDPLKSADLDNTVVDREENPAQKQDPNVISENADAKEDQLDPNLQFAIEKDAVKSSLDNDVSGDVISHNIKKYDDVAVEDEKAGIVNVENNKTDDVIAQDDKSENETEEDEKTVDPTDDIRDEVTDDATIEDLPNDDVTIYDITIQTEIHEFQNVSVKKSSQDEIATQFEESILKNNDVNLPNSNVEVEESEKLRNEVVKEGPKIEPDELDEESTETSDLPARLEVVDSSDPEHSIPGTSQQKERPLNSINGDPFEDGKTESSFIDQRMPDKLALESDKFDERKFTVSSFFRAEEHKKAMDDTCCRLLLVLALVIVSGLIAVGVALAIVKND